MDLDWLLFGFLSKVFRRGCDNCNFYIHTNLSLLYIFWNTNKISVSVSDLERSILVFCRKFTENAFFLKKKLLFSFADLERNVLAFCWKFFDGAVTTAIVLSIRTFPWYFFETIKISVSVSNHERSILAFCRKITENVFFWKKIMFSFADLERYGLAFCQKLQFACPKDCF